MSKTKTEKEIQELKEAKAPYQEIAIEMIGTYKASATNSDIFLQADVIDTMFTPFIKVLAREMTFMATYAGATRKDRRNAIYTKFDIVGDNSAIHDVVLRDRKTFWANSKVMFLDLSCHGNEIKVWKYLKDNNLHDKITEVNIDKITEAIVLRNDDFSVSDEERKQIIQWIQKNICYYHKEEKKGLREELVDFFDVFLGQYNFDPLNEGEPKDKYVLMGATPPENVQIMTYDEYRKWNEDEIAKAWDPEVEAFLEEERKKHSQKK